jgi:hypothetical protein
LSPLSHLWFSRSHTSGTFISEESAHRYEPTREAAMAAFARSWQGASNWPFVMRAPGADN